MIYKKYVLSKYYWFVENVIYATIKEDVKEEVIIFETCFTFALHHNERLVSKICYFTHFQTHLHVFGPNPNEVHPF